MHEKDRIMPVYAELVTMVVVFQKELNFKNNRQKKKKFQGSCCEFI